MVQLFGKIYVLGGYNYIYVKDLLDTVQRPMDSVEVFDTQSGVWSESVPMLSKRFGLGVATLNGKIYACGGYDGSSFLRSVECFDPVTNT